MSPVLPFDIIDLIIDIVGENKDTNLLKELALVSQYFLQICSKHLFATVELHKAHHVKKGFIELLKSRPDVVKYIRKLTYELGYHDDDHLLQVSPILFNFLPTISRLNCLKISSMMVDWNTLNYSMTSAFLHLIHLPTINHIDISFIQNFPISSLTSSVNLLRLDINNLSGIDPLEEEIVVQSEMMPKIREFHTSDSSKLTTMLLHTKRHDGRLAFNFMDLRRLSMSFTRFNKDDDEQNFRHLLQNAKLLEKLHLSVDLCRTIVGLLSPCACTLKTLDLTVFLYRYFLPPLSGLCEELEAMAGHNMLETLSLKVRVECDETEDFIGAMIEKVGNVLVKPGWSALRQVSFNVSISPWGNGKKLSEALQSLPDKYLSHLSKLESVAFNYSAYVHSS